jgi:hypothetical protein
MRLLAIVACAVLARRAMGLRPSVGPRAATAAAAAASCCGPRRRNFFHLAASSS